MAESERVRLLMDLSGPAHRADVATGVALVSGKIEAYLGGRRVYSAVLTDADEAEVRATEDELAKALEDAGADLGGLV